MKSASNPYQGFEALFISTQGNVRYLKKFINNYTNWIRLNKH